MAAAAPAPKRRRHSDMRQIDFYQLGMMEILCKQPRQFDDEDAPIQDWRFTDMFGTSPAVVAWIWNRLKPYETLDEPGRMEPKHMLWGLLLMKVYGKEEQMLALAGGVDNKTFRKWAWLFVDAIASLEPEVVSSFCLLSFLQRLSNSASSLSNPMGEPEKKRYC